MRDAKFVATAYHEASHAILGMICGQKLKSVHVLSNSTGYCRFEKTRLDVPQLSSRALSEKKMPAELVIYWRNRYLIADAGQIGESELSPLSGHIPKDFAYSDELNKTSCMPSREDYWRVRRFYKRQFRPFKANLFRLCSEIIQTEAISDSITSLAEMLVRKPDLRGDEVMNLLMTNRINKTRQLDLFWEPIDESIIDFASH